ncbi:MAG: hypothetical protein DI551_04420 [Micavibrio aeruginosavorus]|uniref:Uncharacterized protein n=1 Tax=Micavibrio aeruginosavorus TaxID=349221 RepID=A0A2W5N365_9BACT|nr:MAG: hypothetical protein DI551_04420 [Micavibrio aeruginosavorus]
METAGLQFTDNSSLKGREDRYTVVRVDASAILKSWRQSLFSFEWLHPDGSIRGLDDLPLHERDKRIKVEKHLKVGDVLERPVLGIGMLDNVEIGAGRDIFLTLAAQGVPEIEVHVPVSSKSEFASFIRG